VAGFALGAAKILVDGVFAVVPCEAWDVFVEKLRRAGQWVWCGDVHVHGREMRRVGVGMGLPGCV
jgi:hypothetical protein